jgi:hypothetical protein
LICFSASHLGKKELVARGRKFIAKVNPKWWKELVDKASLDLSDDRHEYVVLWSEELQEHFMMYNSVSKTGVVKKKCVLTNAFVNLDTDRRKKDIRMPLFPFVYC